MITLRARFEDYEAFEQALHALKESRFNDYDAYGPTNLQELEKLMPETSSFVRGWSTAGAIIGLTSFWLMCVVSVLIYHIIVGGKPPVSNVPFVIPAYEGTILFGSIAAFAATIAYARLGLRKPPASHEPRFTGDSYGIEVRCEGDVEKEARDLLGGADEIRGGEAK